MTSLYSALISCLTQSLLIHYFQYMWVMPSSSARCAQLPRAADKVPFYAALKKFRDYLNGIISEIDEKEMVFSFSKLKNFFEPDIKEEMDDGSCRYDHDGPTLNSVKKEDEVPKKKRGRPKKIKIEVGMVCPNKLPIAETRTSHYG